MFGETAPMDLVRLAIPRRTYTQSHIDYVIEAILEVWKRREEIRGLELVYQAPFLRHFTARFRRITEPDEARSLGEAKETQAGPVSGPDWSGPPHSRNWR